MVARVPWDGATRTRGAHVGPSAAPCSRVLASGAGQELGGGVPGAQHGAQGLLGLGERALEARARCCREEEKMGLNIEL